MLPIYRTYIPHSVFRCMKTTTDLLWFVVENTAQLLFLLWSFKCVLVGPMARTPSSRQMFFAQGHLQQPIGQAFNGQSAVVTSASLNRYHLQTTFIHEAHFCCYHPKNVLHE